MNDATSDDTRLIGFDEIEVKGFSRSVAELEWLVLVLVLLYYVAPTLYVKSRISVIAGMGCFAAFIFVFHYLNFYRRESRWKIAVETWAMIAFITWTLYFTGGLESPLLNLYLLVIITCGLTLGKLMTLLELGLITACYLWLGHDFYSMQLFTMGRFSELMSRFAPFLLVAYLTTMLSADLHYAKRAFKKLSEIDDLTGIFNRRAFKELLDREAKKAERYNRPLSVMMIDADELKCANDNYGHEAGDKLVQLVVDTVKRSLRDSDTVARVGGDEFVVLMPETDAERALEAAQRIRVAVADASLVLNQESVRTTVSIGVASFPDHGSGAADLLQKADAAMYRSKDRGRNCVTSYDQNAVN